MFDPNRKFTVEQGTTLHWRLQGKPGENANLELALRLQFVVTPTDSGLVILHDDSVIPEEVELGWSSEGDVIAHHGRVIWLKGRNGLVVWYHDEAYELFRVLDSAPEGGVLYFHTWPPTEFGGSGEIVWTPEQFLEVASAE